MIVKSIIQRTIPSVDTDLVDLTRELVSCEEIFCSNNSLSGAYFKNFI